MKKLFILAFAALGMLACTGQNDPSNPDNPINGELTGAFSVSESQKVHFSQGNLRYQASTNKWQFAEHQWDTIGSANANMSDSYAGWIDLFCWGTGDNPTKEIDVKSGEDYPFAEWGDNPITNGGNKAKMWRTLTKDEWLYLFCTRTNAATLFALGSVNGVNGAILLPDNWVLPAGASFIASTQQGFELNNICYRQTNYDNYYDNNNIYTAEQWAVMESAGAVFLPAAGYGPYTLSRFFSGGCYWSATSCSSSGAYSLYFESEGLYPQSSKGERDERLSVRLVR